jgi:hypothetical protein
MTVALTTLSAAGYVRYQRLAAESHTTTAKAHEAERLASDIGLLTTDGELLLNCESYCTISLRLDVSPPVLLPAQAAGAGEAAQAASSTLSFFRIVHSHFHVVSKSGKKCEIPAIFFAPATSGYGELVRAFDGVPSCGILTTVGTVGSDGKTRATAVIHGGIDQADIDHIDFLDETDKVVFSVQVYLDTQGKFHLTTPRTADSATQVANTAFKKFITTGGGALLAFFVMSVLGWMVARGRFAPRRAPQRRGKAEGDVGSGQQSACDKAWADRLTIGLIASAVRALDHPDDRDRYREEWAADSDDIPGKWHRLRWALLLRLCAPIGIRSARRDALSMSPPQQQ